MSYLCSNTVKEIIGNHTCAYSTKQVWNKLRRTNNLMCFNYIIFSFSPPHPAQLKKARTKRLKEIKMKAALKEIFAFFFFLLCLMDVAQYHRDPNTYLLSKTLTETFVDVDAFSIPLYSVSLLFHSNYNCTCKIFTLLTVPSDVHHITVRGTSLYFDVGKANCELLLPGTAQLKS